MMGLIKVFLTLAWYGINHWVFFFNACMWWGNHNRSFLGHKSSNIWFNTVTFGWGYYPSLHAYFFPQRALPSPLPLLCYSFLLLLVSARDKKECLHWTNSSSHDTSSLIPSDSCQFKTQEKPSVWGWGTWIALVIITLKRQGFAVAVPSSDFSWLCPEDHPHHSK